jgi:hypothetical protein
MPIQGLRSKDLVTIAIFSRVIIFSVALVGDLTISDFQFSFEPPQVKLPIIQAFARWDSFYYLDIATHGYSLKPDLWAFRPLYPTILCVMGFPLTLILGKWESYLIAGLLWNMLAYVFATIYLYRFTEMLLDSSLAYYTILLFNIFPGAIFFTAVYAEATYLLMLLIAFYYLEKEKILLATLFGMLASFTRPEGFLIFIPFFWKALFSDWRNRKMLLVSVVAILLTLPFFMMYGYWVINDPFISFKVEERWPKMTFFTLLFSIIQLKPFDESLDRIAVYPIAFALLIIVFSSFFTYFFSCQISKRAFHIEFKRNWRDEKTSYYLWALLLSLLLLFYGGFGGFPRFVSVLFPILWSNSLWVKNNPLGFYFLLILYVCFMTLGTILFVNWYYFL